MATITWTIQARCDLRRVHDYISDHGAPETAGRFTDALAASVGRLQKSPKRGTILPEADDPNFRHLRFRSYRIVYRIEGGTVFILRIWHHRRLLTHDDL